MLYLTCTMISSVDLADYGVSRAKIGYLWIVVQSGIEHMMEIQSNLDISRSKVISHY